MKKKEYRSQNSEYRIRKWNNGQKKNTEDEIKSLIPSTTLRVFDGDR
jgi:hypothetical protein